MQLGYMKLVILYCHFSPIFWLALIDRQGDKYMSEM